MEIFPAIDLLDGKVVRLYQGDYGQKQVYGDNPADFARGFANAKAKNIHLVDLDGAREGGQRNFAVIQEILSAADLFAELGGGIRNEETVSACLDAGVGRVILGTAALNSPDFTRRMVEKYGDKIAVGVDARDGKVAVEGWLATSKTNSIDFCKEMQNIGVKYIIYTDISCDGAQTGTNLKVYDRLSNIQGLNITASGGVSSLGDIEALKEMGLYAAIVGKALYSGALKLEDAIEAAKN